MLILYYLYINILYHYIIKAFYNESEACVRVERGVSEWFSVKVGLRQGCVLLCNVTMVV